MSESMASIIEAHGYDFIGLTCGCGVPCGADEDALTYARHLEDQLAKAGYGNVREATGGETPEQYAARIDRVLHDPARIERRKRIPPAFSVPRHRFPDRKELAAAMAAAISRSSITERPIIRLDEGGDICIDLPRLADAILAAGYVKSDHIEYAAEHEHAGLDIMDEGGELFIDRGGIEREYKDYPNVALMQRTVGPWVPVGSDAEAGK